MMNHLIKFIQLTKVSNQQNMKNDALYNYRVISHALTKHNIYRKLMNRLYRLTKTNDAYIPQFP